MMLEKIAWLIQKSREEKETTITKTHENLFDIIREEYEIIDNEPILYDKNVGLLLVDTQRVLRLPKVYSEDGVCTRRFNQTIMQSKATQILVDLIRSLYNIIDSTDVLKNKTPENLKYRIKLCFKESDEALGVLNKEPEFYRERTRRVEYPQFLNRLI